MGWLKKTANILLSNIGIYFGIFVAVWLIGWTANAIYKTGFDLARLEELGKYILGKYVTDSGLNTNFMGKTAKEMLNDKAGV